MAIRYAMICDSALGLDTVVERNLDGLAESSPGVRNVIDEIIKKRIFEANIIEGNMGYEFNPDQKGIRTKLNFHKLGYIWVADIELFNIDNKLIYHELMDGGFRLNKLKERTYEVLKKFVLQKYNLSKNGEIVSMNYNITPMPKRHFL